jgi:hypothetical protein
MIVSELILLSQRKEGCPVQWYALAADHISSLTYVHITERAPQCGDRVIKKVAHRGDYTIVRQRAARIVRFISETGEQGVAPPLGCSTPPTSHLENEMGGLCLRPFHPNDAAGQTAANAITKPWKRCGAVVFLSEDRP